MKRHKYLKLYLEGRIDFQEAYTQSRILQRVVSRIIENSRLSDEDAHGLYSLYAQYGKRVVEALKRDGLVEIKVLRFSPYAAKLIARPTNKLLTLVDDTAI